MRKNMSDLSLNERVLKTLEIVEKRGYNLSIEKLSKCLLGGEIDFKELELNIKNLKNIDYDGTYVATSGNLKSEKCEKRKLTNNKLQPIYLKVIKEYVIDFVKLCPWIRCIMISGSMATDGLGEDDDIDINIVVKDNSKYKSYLLALLISLKFSIRYKKQFNAKYFNFLKKVICINVIWEEQQIKPFIRRDEQIAYELLNAKVIFNLDFFNKLLESNLWLKDWFPQIYKKNFFIKDTIENISKKHYKKKSSKILEKISLVIFFSIFKMVRLARSKDKTLLDRMDYVERVKYPYGFLNVPKNR